MTHINCNLAADAALYETRILLLMQLLLFCAALASQFDSVFVASMNMQYDHRRISMIQSRYLVHSRLHEQTDKQRDRFR